MLWTLTVCHHHSSYKWYKMWCAFDWIGFSHFDDSSSVIESVSAYFISHFVPSNYAHTNTHTHRYHSMILNRTPLLFPLSSIILFIYVDCYSIKLFNQFKLWTSFRFWIHFHKIHFNDFILCFHFLWSQALHSVWLFIFARRLFIINQLCYTVAVWKLRKKLEPMLCSGTAWNRPRAE